jgi:septal ring factor EnvC (AmiA/AmiB activator)
MDTPHLIEQLRTTLTSLEEELQKMTQENQSYVDTIDVLKQTIERLETASVQDKNLIAQLSSQQQQSSKRRAASLFSWN